MRWGRRLAALATMCVVLSGCAAEVIPLSAYVPASPQEAGVLVPLLAIIEGVRDRNVDTIVGAYASDARIANFADIFSRPSLIRPAMQPVVTREELRSLYETEFATTSLTSVKFYDPRIHLADPEATVTVQERMARVDRLWRSRRVMYAAEAVFKLRREPAGWRIVEDRYDLRGYTVF